MTRESTATTVEKTDSLRNKDGSDDCGTSEAPASEFPVGATQPADFFLALEDCHAASAIQPAEAARAVKTIEPGVSLRIDDDDLVTPTDSLPVRTGLLEVIPHGLELCLRQNFETAVE